MLAIPISRKAFRYIKVWRTAGNCVQNCRRYDCSSDLRSHVGRYVLCWEATSGGQPERDSWIEMASRDVPDGIRHGEYRQAEGSGPAEKSNANLRKSGCDDRAAAPAE